MERVAIGASSTSPDAPIPPPDAPIKASAPVGERSLGAPASLPAPSNTTTNSEEKPPSSHSVERSLGAPASLPAPSNTTTNSEEKPPSSHSDERSLGAPASLPAPNNTTPDAEEKQRSSHSNQRRQLRNASGNGNHQRTDGAETKSDGVDVVEDQPPDFSSPECPACWTALRVTDKFCCWCGEPQPNRVLPFMKLCLNCNTLLPEKANYCYACGTDVGYNSRRKVRVPHELFRDEESEFFPRFDA